MTLASAAIALLLFPGIGPQPSPPSPAALAAAIQKKYDTIRDFSARFTQVYEGGTLRRRVVDRGTLQVKKPGRIRWGYETPEEKLFVSDGRQFYSYIPADKKGYVRAVPAGDEAGTALLFLAGRGRLTRDFTVAAADASYGGQEVWAVKLVPRRAERDYDWLVLVVDRSSFRIRQLVAGDPQGGRSTFTLTDFKENPGLSDKIFAFQFPRGVDVERIKSFD